MSSRMGYKVIIPVIRLLRVPLILGNLQVARRTVHTRYCNETLSDPERIVPLCSSLCGLR